MKIPISISRKTLQESFDSVNIYQTKMNELSFPGEYQMFYVKMVQALQKSQSTVIGSASPTYVSNQTKDISICVV